MPTVFMIRNKTTGLYCMGGNGNVFKERGKVWSSTISFSAFLGNFKLDELGTTFADCEFLSFDLSTPTTTQDVNTFVKRAKLKIAITEQYSDPNFTAFVDKLDKENLSAKFPWIVYIVPAANGRSLTKDQADVFAAPAKDAIKRLKIKRENYRTSSTAFAFADKGDAFKFRLSLTDVTLVFETETLLAVD